MLPVGLATDPLVESPALMAIGPHGAGWTPPGLTLVDCGEYNMLVHHCLCAVSAGPCKIRGV